MYTLVKTQEYACKNNLQKAIYKLLRRYDRTMFRTLLEVTTFVEELKILVSQLAEIYDKCTPLELSKWTTDYDVHIRVESVIQMSFYHGATDYKLLQS